MQELDRIVGRIREYPDGGAPYLEGTRRYLMRGFLSLWYIAKAGKQIFSCRSWVQGLAASDPNMPFNGLDMCEIDAIYRDGAHYNRLFGRESYPRPLLLEGNRSGP
jgi:hypothetical protein